MTKKLKVYQILTFALGIAFVVLCAYMGITAVQKSMKLKMSFNVEPAILCQIDIKASGADDSTYKTIFNNVSSTLAENITLSGNTLILNETFLNAYKTTLGAAIVLKITNLLDNDGIRVTTAASGGVNATSEVIMQKKGTGDSAQIKVNITNTGALTLNYEICDEIASEMTYNITYENIVCVDSTANNSANPTTYKNTDSAFLLIEPTKTGCEFLGWTYAGQTEPTKSVSIPQGTAGNLTFTANWGAELMSAEDYWDVMKSNLSYTTDSWPPDGYANVFHITSLTYGFWEEEKTNLTNYDSYAAGINLDAAGQGYIKLFIEGTKLYILSPNIIISKDSNSNGIIGWGCANDVSAAGFSHGTRSISSITIKNFAFSEGAFLKGAFGNSSAKYIDLSGLDTSNATTMYRMFYDCMDLISLDLSGFDTSKVTDMSYMFFACRSLTCLDLSSFDTSSVTNMERMFSGRSSNLSSLDLTNFDTSNVTNMSYMFSAGGSWTSLDLSSFNTSKVTDMSYMFHNCSLLLSLDLSSFDTSSVSNMSSMFDGCSNVVKIYVSEKWSVGEDVLSSNMFYKCVNLPNFNSSFVTKSRAHYNAGGYLTYKAAT